MDYEALGLKVGLEIHQQLKTHKLFCNCPSELHDSYEHEFVRTLRPTQSELGEVDRAALAEARKKKRFRYQVTENTCLVEADEEPPHRANPEAINTVLEFACLVGAEPLDEIHFMRKIVIDGSNTSGFQRTALIAMGGEIELEGGQGIGLMTICLEEDAARNIAQNEKETIYRLDRLGIPLIEIATEPVISSPIQARNAALKIGELLRAMNKVRRGIGTIREDVNISISGGARVEIKGVQEPKMIATYVEEEIARQLRLIYVKDEFRNRGVNKDDFFEMKDLTYLFRDTECNVIKRMLDRRGIVQGIKLSGFTGLLGDELSDVILKDMQFEPKFSSSRYILGPEFAAYMKQVGVKGLFHSDELPAFGITDEEVEQVKKEMQVGNMDAFVLIAEKKEVARAAAELLISRALQAFEGVPEETRDAMPDGTTSYSRPLAGEARMYPETDVPPVRITKTDIERIRSNLPELPKEKLLRFVNNYSINEEQAKQLIKTGLDGLFEDLAREFPNTKMQRIIARSLLNTVPELESEGVNVDKITTEMWSDLFQAVDQGKLAKEGIPELLKFSLERESSIEVAITQTGLGTVDKEHVQNILDEIITDNMALVKEKGLDAVGPLMGLAMKKLRGKADGRLVSEILRKKVQNLDVI